MDETYEVDIDADAVDELKPKLDNITKEGFLLKGPEIGIVYSIICIIDGNVGNEVDIIFFFSLVNLISTHLIDQH